MTKRRYVFPDNCNHRNFFDCHGPKGCLGCYYHPDELVARGPRFDGEEGEGLWFYENAEWAEKSLKMLENMKAGRGRLPGGTKVKFRYNRDNEPAEENFD